MTGDQGRLCFYEWQLSFSLINLLSHTDVTPKLAEGSAFKNEQFPNVMQNLDAK
jgi:hypothetical protein